MIVNLGRVLIWNDFECEEFLFCERTAVIIKPIEKPNGRMLLKTEYLDAPVLNILSQVGFGEHKSDVVDNTWRELVAAYGFNKSTVVNFRKSPIDNMRPLIDNNIPVITVCGNADSIVVYEENGKVLEDYYKENSGNIIVIFYQLKKGFSIIKQEKLQKIFRNNLRELKNILAELFYITEIR